MLDWITGQRVPELGEAVENETYIDVPDTPAPVFAVRAFKHALFGTPKPEDIVREQPLPNRTKSTKSTASVERFQSLDDRETRNNSSPPKHKINVATSVKPASIMMTPKTANGRRKNVVFDEEVIDNEGKKPMLPRSRTGLPCDFPGKFPSPYTPKEKLMVHSRSAPSLSDSIAIRNGLAGSATRVRSKDDADITFDLMEPRSESGRYWKDLHVAYARQSERQVKKLITKHKLAKQFAKSKDAEATEAKVRLESERKKFRSRSSELEDQIKELKEQLRLAMAENTKSSTEIALLRKKLLESQQPKSEVQTHVDIDPPQVSLDARLDALRPKPSAFKSDALERQKMMRPSKQQKIPPRKSSRADTTTSIIITAGKAPTTTTIKTDADSSVLPFSPINGLSSEANPFSSPTATATLRSARSTSSYRVTKRPISLTIAKPRIPQSVEPQILKPHPALESALKDVPGTNRAAIDETDIWNLTELDSAISKTPKSVQGRAGPGLMDDHTLMGDVLPRRPSTSPSPSLAQVAKLASPSKSSHPTEFPSLLTKAEQTARSPRHFPGSPHVSSVLHSKREPLKSSISSGNARAVLPQDKQIEAQARIDARRAAKQKRKAQVCEKPGVTTGETDVMT